MISLKQAYDIARKYEHKFGNTLSVIVEYEEAYGFRFIPGDDPDAQYAGGWSVAVDKKTGRAFEVYLFSDEWLKLHFVNNIPRNKVL